MNNKLEKELRAEISALQQQLQKQAEAFQREIERMRDQHQRELREAMYVRLMEERHMFGYSIYPCRTMGADLP